MANHGPMHWRGDRTGGNDPGGDPLAEDQAFKKFIVAFAGLLGRSGPISDPDMQRFTDFILQVTYPPNPNRPLDNQLTGAALAGRNFFFGPTSDTFTNCDGCHVLDPVNGFFGTDGQTTFEAETQMFKVAHLRNLYQKVGMFGMPAVAGLRAGNNGNQGPQVRGFGFLHDGSVDTTFRFHRANVFNTTVTDAQNLEQFMFQFDTNLAPIVGQQITLTSTNAATVNPRIDLLITRAAANECEVVVKGTVNGEQRGAVRLASGQFRTDRASEATLSDAQVRALAATAGQDLTYTCVPPGNGTRIGIDRDEDGFLDRTELDAGSDPADPASVPGGGTTTTTTTTPGGTTTTTTLAGAALTIQTRSFSMKSPGSSPVGDPKVSFKSTTKLDPPTNRIVPPGRGSAGDPVLNGAVLRLYNSAGLSSDLFVFSLFSEHWKYLGSLTNPKGYKYSDSSTNLIKSVTIKADTIKIRGAAIYSLDEQAQGRVAIRLDLGTGPRYCADAPPKVSGNPPSTAQNDRPGRFIAQSKTPPPAACPVLP